MADVEPDYRFTLANERTFLAWQRTSLGLLAAAVALVIPALLAAAAAAAGCTYLIALHRQRMLQQRPMPARITPRRQVYSVGVAVLMLIAVTAATELL